MPTTEEQGREIIDQKLTAAGWVVQDSVQLNLGAALMLYEFIVEKLAADT